LKEAGECLNAANRLFKAAVLVFVAAALCFNAFAEQAGKVKEITPRFRRHVTEYYKHNTDAVGWLNVPGTNISDVVAQNPPNNNAFYLTHDFFGRPDRDGIFAADRRCSLIRGGELSRNTTIYGHTWDEDPHGNLFHQLKRFQDPNFAKDHPYIFFSTEDKDMALKYSRYIIQLPTCLISSRICHGGALQALYKSPLPRRFIITAYPLIKRIKSLLYRRAPMTFRGLEGFPSMCRTSTAL